MAVESIQLSQRVGKKQGGELKLDPIQASWGLSIELQGLLQQVINKTAEQQC